MQKEVKSNKIISEIEKLRRSAMGISSIDDGTYLQNDGGAADLIEELKALANEASLSVEIPLEEEVNYSALKILNLMSDDAPEPLYKKIKKYKIE